MEEDSHDGQIGDGPLMVVGGPELHNGSMEVDKQMEQDRAHSGCGWWILLAVGVKVLVKLKVHLAKYVVPRVRDPKLAKVWAMDQKYCSMGHLQTGQLLVACLP
jgi:hypothetical protein